MLLGEMHPLQQLHSKNGKGGGYIFEGGLIFGGLRYMINKIPVKASAQDTDNHRTV